MDFTERLRESAEETGSIISMGMDPVLEKIPLKGDIRYIIKTFYLEILDAIVSEDVKPPMVKPNIAFYEQYGFDGLRALKDIISAYKSEGIMVLLDCKRADIGKTSLAYAKAVFDFWKVDAVTTNPYMGFDSIKPFIDYCSKGKGVYILCRTSNKGAIDVQDIKIGRDYLYMKIAENIVEWHKDGVCAVVGATYIHELNNISKFFVTSKKTIPLLIPGVGAQGGSVCDVVKALKDSGNELKLQRINSSSGINFAYERFKTEDFAGAAAKAIKELNKDIGKI